jgi:hypothetical protein
MQRRARAIANQKLAINNYFLVSIEPPNVGVECRNGMDNAFAVCFYSNDNYMLINTMIGDNISDMSEFTPPLSRLERAGSLRV